MGAGGGQRVCVEMVRAFLHLGWRVQVLASRDSFLHSQLRCMEIELLLIDGLARKLGLLARLKRTWSFLQQLWKFRAKMSETVVVVNDPDFFIPAVVISLFATSSHLVLYAHLVYSRMQAAVFRILASFRVVSEVWFASSYLRQHICTRTSLSNKAFVIEPPSRYEVETPNLSSGAWTFASVGLIHPQKGHDVLLQLAKQMPDRKFHIIGPNDPMNLIYSNALQSQASPNVIFSGFVEDLRTYLCTHQIGGLIVASRNNYEAFGLTAVEAVALGRLAVVRRTGGLNEIARSLELFSADNDLDLINLAQVLLLRSDLNLVISNQQEKLMHFYSRSSFTQRLKSLVQTYA